MTICRYLEDGSLSGFMEVADLIPGERPIARFRETWFHPQGGGQKADRGTVGSVPIIEVRHGPDGVVDHFIADLGELRVGGSYRFAVDAEWRRLNSIYHTAAHLVVGVCERLFPGVFVTAGHQWPGQARVEFSGVGFDRIVLGSGALEQLVWHEIGRDLPVRIVGDPYVNRACRIGDFPPIPCSGTHVTTTAKLNQFKIRSAKLKIDHVRLGYEVAVR